jgi:hypothetical protein
MKASVLGRLKHPRYGTSHNILWMKNNKCNASLGQENSVGSTFVHNILGLGEGNAQSNIMFLGKILTFFDKEIGICKV